MTFREQLTRLLSKDLGKIAAMSDSGREHYIERFVATLFRAKITDDQFRRFIRLMAAEEPV